MPKPLSPDIKALRRLDRAAKAIPEDARQRSLQWLVARECGVGYVWLPPVAQNQPEPKAKAINRGSPHD